MTMDKELLEICDVCVARNYPKELNLVPHCGDRKLQGDQMSGCTGGMIKGSVALIVLGGLGVYIFSSLFK